MSDKTTMQKSFKLDLACMNNFEKMSNCIFKSGRLSLRYFEYVNALFVSLSSQNIENQQITSAKYTVVMLCVRQNQRKKAFGRPPPYQELKAWHSRLIAHSHVRWFEQTGISMDAQDRRDLRKHRQDKTVNLHSPIDIIGSSPQLQMLHTSMYHTRR